MLPSVASERTKSLQNIFTGPLRGGDRREHPLRPTLFVYDCRFIYEFGAIPERRHNGSGVGGVQRRLL